MSWSKSERCEVAEMGWVIRVYTPSINFEVDNMNLKIFLISFSLNIWPELLPSRCCQLLGRSSTKQHGTSWKFSPTLQRSIHICKKHAHSRRIWLMFVKEEKELKEQAKLIHFWDHLLYKFFIIIQIKLILDYCNPNNS